MDIVNTRIGRKEAQRAQQSSRFMRPFVVEESRPWTS